MVGFYPRNPVARHESDNFFSQSFQLRGFNVLSISLEGLN
jgi:hypothetical protein